MNALNLPEPTITERGRSINARYDTGLIKEEKYGRDKNILFTLTVSYSKAGINYFTGERTSTDYYTVGVMNETASEGMIGFTLGSGLGVARIEQPNNRFSRKRLREIFEEWKEKVEGIMAVDGNLLDEDEQKMQSAVMPYWNGQKAGQA